MTDLADSSEFAAGLAIGRDLAANEAHGTPARRRDHLRLVPTTPALTAAMRGVADVRADRAAQLTAWQHHQHAALTDLGTAAAHATAAHHARLALRWLPAFGARGRRDHRPPPTVRVDAAAVDNRARLTYFAAHGHHFSSWRRTVRIGTGRAVAHAIDCAAHNHDVSRGTFTTHPILVVRGRYEPTRATLAIAAALLAASGVAGWLTAPWWLPHMLAALALAGRVAGTLLLVAIIAAAFRTGRKDP